MEPAFGQIGSEGDGLGPKQPELFDIHVMLFAGEPAQTVAALEARFSIDRDAAERLIEDVPVVVKRAAEPDVAAEMVDVLGSLGAQVVLLPAASAVPAETDLLELKVPSLPPPRLPSKPAARAQPATSWGGLERPTPRRAETADLIARAPLAELDLGGSNDAELGGASVPPPEEGDDKLVIAPLIEPPSAGREAPAPRGGARTRLEVAAPRADHGESIPPALLGESEDDEEPRVSAPPDLGLGAVPPLPALGALTNARGPGGPPPPPPSAGGAATARGVPLPPPPRPAPPKAASGLVTVNAGRSTYEQTLEGASTALPMLSTVQAPERAAPARAQGDGYWSARRPGAAEAGDAKPAAQEAAGTAALPVRPNTRQRNVEVAPARSVKSLGRPLLEIIAGAVVFAFFAQQDNSILFGNASPLSIVLHGFALYGIGMGIWEIRS